MSKIVYTLESEGKVIYGDAIDDKEIYCGEFFISSYEVSDEDEDDREVLESFIDSMIIEDKWGNESDETPREIINVWDNDLDVEFTNGLISWGEFSTLEEAQKEMEKHFKGSIDVLDLAKEIE